MYSTSWTEFTLDLCPLGFDCTNDIIKNPINSIFIKYTKVPVGLYVYFKRFQLYNKGIGLVFYRNGTEIRLASFRTQGSIFRDYYGYFVPLELVFKRKDFWEAVFKTLFLNSFICYLHCKICRNYQTARYMVLLSFQVFQYAC